MIVIPDGIAPYLIQTQALDYQIRINRLTKRFYAGENIARGRAMYVDNDSRIYHVDIMDESTVDRFVGIAEEDGTTGAVITVCTHGLSQVGGSGWSAGTLYYIGSNGFLTSTEPVSGIVRKVGVGVDPDRILLMPSVGGTGTSSGGECWDAIDGGNADGSMDGGDANAVSSEIIDGGDALC